MENGEETPTGPSTLLSFHLVERRPRPCRRDVISEDGLTFSAFSYKFASELVDFISSESASRRPLHSRERIVIFRNLSILLFVRDINKSFITIKKIKKRVFLLKRLANCFSYVKSITHYCHNISYK